MSRLGLPHLQVAVAGVLAALASLAVAQFVHALWLAPVLLLAGLAGLALLTRPVATLALLTVAQTASFSDVAAEHGIPVVHTALLALGVAVIVLGRRRGELRLSWSPVFALALVYLASRAVPALTSASVQTSFASVVATAKDLLFLVIVVLLLGSTRRYGVFVAATAGTVAALCGLSLVQEFALHNATTFGGFSNVPLGLDLGSATSRHSGPSPDPNFWGRVVVLVVPLALTALAASVRSWTRTFWSLATLLLLGGLYLTSSRGGLLAVAAAVVAWALLAGRATRRWLLGAPLVVALGMLVPGVGSRLATLIAAPTSTGTIEPSIAGREGAQRVALDMFAHHPLVGLGPDTFPLVEPSYQRRLGLLASNPAPHNLYLQLLAETGLVGLAGWLVLVAGTAVVVWRAHRSFALSMRGLAADRRHRLLTAGVLAALVGWSTASAFLHLADFRTLELVLALGAVVGTDRLPVRAWRPAGGTVDVPVPRRPAPGRAQQLTAVAVVLLLAAGTVAVGALLRHRQPSRWVAASRATLVPATGQVDWALPYDYGVASRDLVVPTYVAITANPRFAAAASRDLGLSAAQRSGLQVRVTAADATSLLTVSVTARSPDVAARMSAAVLTEANDYLTSLGGLYVLRPLS